jgi:cytochrome oxidase Cu insertion factor (SCO1/SenC/PrrC family)
MLAPVFLYEQSSPNESECDPHGSRFREIRVMIKKALSLIVLLIFAAVASAQQPSPPKTQLKVGDAAPDFTLTDTEGNPVRLSDFKGKKSVVLAFYVLAFTGG